MRESVLIMVRDPFAGRAKTRLAAVLGSEKAAEFYRLCAGRVLRQVGSLPDAVGKYVAFTDSVNRQRMQEWSGPAFKLLEQAGEDLGERLANAFDSVFSTGAGKAVIIASDVPDISAEIVGRAIEALDRCDIVLGPSHDGGYYLLGMSARHPQLFQGIPWSSAEVTTRTLAAAGKMGLTVFVLPALIDIDNFADFSTWCSLCVQPDEAMADFIGRLGLRQL